MPAAEIQTQPTEPSPWIVRFAPLVRPGCHVLDLACGAGRHTRFLLALGAQVTCVDQDISFLGDLEGKAEIIQADLEDGSRWPFELRRFDAVVVVNYLYRPLMPALVEAVAPGGTFLYETFAVGNERYARPRNPDHLLRPGELLAAVDGQLQVVAYEAGVEDRRSGPRVIERICAVRNIEPVPLPPARSTV